jgi:DNA polymerase
MVLVVSADEETGGTVDLGTQGADKYSRSEDTRCYMLAFHPAGSAEPGRLWLEGDPVPPEWIWHVNNGSYFSGWNVNFFDRLIYNRILVPKHGFPLLSDDAWVDSMHAASAANMPRALDSCGKFIGLPFNVDLKDKNRIRRITNLNKTPIPSDVTMSDILNGRAPEIAGRKTVGKATMLDEFTWLAARCRQDIVMEEDLMLRLPPWPQIEPWRNMPAIDRRINDRGILLDIPLVEGLKTAALKQIRVLNADMERITGGQVTACTKVEDLKQWLVASGVALPDNREPIDEDDPDLDEDDIKELEKANARKSPWKLRKSDMADLLARPDLPEACRLAVAMRAEASKVSTSKFNRMLWNVSPDGRLRNTMTLGGAQQTLRFASRGCNLYNTVRDVFGNPDEIAELHGLDGKTEHDKIMQLQGSVLYDAIMVGRSGDNNLIGERYTRIRKDAQGRDQTLGVMTWISRMTRRTLAAPAGHLLLNGDYAQVEARITVWLAQQLDVLNAFASGQDVYKIIAAGIYKCTPEQLTKTQRQAGKVACLACGFGGGTNALLAMAYGYGLMLTVDEAAEIVKGFRATNQALVKYWYATDDAAAKAVQYPGYEFPVGPLNLVSYFMQGDCLCCRLPSGRLLRYWQPRLTQEYWADGRAKDRLSLSGIAIKGKSVFRRSLYHTICFENQVQSIGADMLATGLQNMDQAGIPVVLHVYDSAAAEVPENRAHAMVPVFDQCMLAQPSWTAGLPIDCDTEVSSRFG